MRIRTIGLLSIGMAALLAVSAQAQEPGVYRSHQAGTASIPANTQANPRDHGPTPTQLQPACVYSFTTGSGATYMNYCITANGTFYNFQSPSGVEMLDPNNIGAFEGYSLCDLTNSSALVEYFDYGFNTADAEGNVSAAWDAPVTVSTSASAVTIERTTADGNWTLTQTITKEAGPPPYAKVVMVLKNTSGLSRLVDLLRFAAMTNSAAGGGLAENYDATYDSAWGYNSYADSGSDGGAVYGLMLQNVDLPKTDSFWQGEPQNEEAGPNPCSPYYAVNGTLTYGSGSVWLGYGNVTLGKGKSLTVTLKYAGF